MKYILFIGIASILTKSVLTLGFLREFLFPTNPRVTRVRKLDNSARSISEPVVLDFVGLVENYGYPAEEHHLTTEDGYNLILHRIPNSPMAPSSNTKKPVVFLQHGIFGSSDTWVWIGPKKDLAFILADEGYDVWVGNIRGNTYCRSHVELSPRDREFWMFSYHEVGVHDLSAMIDYTLKISGQKKIYYIGHSMGTTLSYVLLSTKPEYNEKIRLTISLAPIALWIRPPLNPLLTIALRNSEFIKEFTDRNQIYDLFPQTTNNARLASGICSDNSTTQTACINFIFSNIGADLDQLNTTLLPHFISYFPAGTSILLVHHYAQNINQRAFQQYDYGYIQNFRIYGKKRPPLYNITDVTAPVAVIHSENDLLMRRENIAELIKKLPNVVDIHKVSNNKFNHLDYIWARDVKKFLHNKIIQLLATY